MQAVDALTVSVVVDNSSDMLSTRPAHIASELRVLISAGMKELTGEGLCSAHHGLSLAVTARFGAKERTVLFDAGPDPYALERNVRRMGLDFGNIEAVVLSHGHFDHAEGLLKAIEAHSRNQTSARGSPPSSPWRFCSPCDSAPQW
jgi:7,8-dihydropterin-6-yl-methyl-4-(beta-D-ribofuranosyl)aminobenzene 5'-phosphate synthase